VVLNLALAWVQIGGGILRGVMSLKSLALTLRLAMALMMRGCRAGRSFTLVIWTGTWLMRMMLLIGMLQSGIDALLSSERIKRVC
jgi:hypothetical protein